MKMRNSDTLHPFSSFMSFKTDHLLKVAAALRGGVLKIHAHSQTATSLSSARVRRVQLWPKRQPVLHVRHHNVLNQRALFLSVARFLRLRGFSVAAAAHARFFGAAGWNRKSPPRFAANALFFRRFSCPKFKLAQAGGQLRGSEECLGRRLEIPCRPLKNKKPGRGRVLETSGEGRSDHFARLTIRWVRRDTLRLAVFL